MEKELQKIGFKMSIGNGLWKEINQNLWVAFTQYENEICPIQNHQEKLFFKEKRC